MKRIIKAVGPCTMKLKRNRFQTLVNSIISQQITVKAAETIMERLMETTGGNSLKPEHLADFDVDSLRELGVSRQKATYLIDLTSHVSEGVIDLSKMSRLDDETVIEHLTQVKGIGRWTAQMFLMFSLGRMDVFPVDDLGIKNGILKTYQLEEEPSRDEMYKLSEPWRPYSTIASWYLWRS